MQNSRADDSEGFSSSMSLSNYLGDNGTIACRLSGYEPRAGQLAMAEAVYQVISAKRLEYGGAEMLLVEAETGIGKTLAYLLPAVLSGRKTIVSTATITLQDQILKKEIPLLQQAMGQDFPVVCVKGRQNYLCLYRWYQYRGGSIAGREGSADAEKIEQWLQYTETGDRAELDWLPDSSPLWQKISAQSHQCLGGDCPEAALCFINELRRRAAAAQLVVVNHHLFFSDLALRKSGYGEVLPRYEAVIFDEAHHIENIASTFFGKSFSQYQVVDCLADIERQAEADLSPSQSDKIKVAARGIKERVEQFASIFPGEKGRYPLQDFIEQTPVWHDEVKNLSVGLERICGELEGLEQYGEGWRTLARRVDQLRNNLVEIGLPEAVPEIGSYVHWYEQRERSVTLSATPVHIAGNLQGYLYPNIQSCIMTSATLTSGGDFTYVRGRLGIDEDAPALRFSSPFNYKENSRIYVPRDSFPLPSERTYMERLCPAVCELLRLSRGRALILSTSFRGMESIAEYLEENSEYPLLVQGRASRHTLLQRFREEHSSVLVAVASFWEGVDVPGESLSCVIIDKLPFDVPSDPVLQARIAHIQESGGNPFFDFQVPRAILSLRQGVGRLIRSSSDKGLIAVMDTRLYKKGYGKVFLSSLPPSPVVRNLDEVAEFMNEI